MPSKDVDELIRALLKAGWRVEQGKRHPIAYPPDKTQTPVTLSSTPSDRRAFANMVSLLRQRGFYWKGR